MIFFQNEFSNVPLNWVYDQMQSRTNCICVFFFTVDLKMHAQNGCEKEGIFIRKMFYNYWKVLLLFRRFFVSHIFTWPLALFPPKSCWKLPLLFILFPYQSDDHSRHERPVPAAVVNSKSNANMAFARFNKQPLEASPSMSSSSSSSLSPLSWLLTLLDYLTLNWVMMVNSF